eukprot:TRINITY_DN1769_c0_g2_i1.p1 TRINITY_DN1769_c0_g2~~TRINITY_DN1769_c0_g2_i1.p1  ORF type:complete len:385 (+),score=136.93 TRINITY_DN1769_c0_g2_i1:92-1246(+)
MESARSLFEEKEEDEASKASDPTNQKQIQKLNAKIFHLNGLLDEQTALIDTMENDKRSLEKKINNLQGDLERSKKALEAVEHERFELNRKLSTLQISSKSAALDSKAQEKNIRYENQIADLQGQLVSLNKAKVKIGLEKDNLQAEVANLQKKLEDEQKSLRAEIRTMTKKYTEEVEFLKNRLKSEVEAREKSAEVSRLISSGSATGSGSEYSTNLLRAKVEEQNLTIQAMKSAQSSMELKITKLNSQIDQYQKQINESNAAKARLEKDVKDLKIKTEEMSVASRAIGLPSMVKATGTIKTEEEVRGPSSATPTGPLTDNVKKMLQKENTELKQKIIDLDSDITRLNQEKRRLNGELDKLRKELRTEKARVDQLQFDITNLSKKK